jgi:Peptidase family S41
MSRTGRRQVIEASPMTWAERLETIECLQLFLAETYVHLTLKKSLYGFDILRALENLKQQSTLLNDIDFHREITTLINRLRDAHTQYKGPWTKSGAIVSLPFLVEPYGPREKTEFVVSKIDRDSIKDKNFTDGVSITHWNGIPFERALSMHADVETGGRFDSRRARAVESMTFRALEYAPPPNEEWVDVTYVDLARKQRTARFKWEDFDPEKAPHASGNSVATRFARSIHFGAELVRRAKKRRFNHAKWMAEKRKRGKSGPRAVSVEAFSDFITADIKMTAHGKFGYLRIWSFDVDDDEAFIEAVTQALRRLPDRGLIIDIRNNPGGLIYAAERLLQLFTPNPVLPTKFALRSTPVIAEMARAQFNRDELGPWSSSLDSAQNTGEPFSSHLPITPVERCNDLGQRYGGPIVVVADANTYSSGDLFAAGVVDNAIGPLVCVGQATGAGGANVWTAENLVDALRPVRSMLPSLPRGVDFTMSVRRAVRAGASDGSLIEDVGVVGQAYDLTSTDVLNGNRDLIEHCASILAAQPLTKLLVNTGRQGIQIQTAGLDVLDVYVDSHPVVPSFRVAKDGKKTLKVKLRKGTTLDVLGFASGTLRQKRRLFI